MLVVVRTSDRRVTVRGSYRIDRVTACDSELLKSGVLHPTSPQKNQPHRHSDPLPRTKKKDNLCSSMYLKKRKTIHAFIQQITPGGEPPPPAVGRPPDLRVPGGIARPPTQGHGGRLSRPGFSLFAPVLRLLQPSPGRREGSAAAPPGGGMPGVNRANKHKTNRKQEVRNPSS